MRARWVCISENVGGPITWKVVTEKTQKDFCWSAIRTALDPSMKNFSLDPLKSTNFEILPSPRPSSTGKAATTPPPLNPDSYGETTEKVVIYFRDDREKSDGTRHKFKSVSTDENCDPKKDSNTEMIYIIVPHLDKIPGINFCMPDPATILLTHIAIGKLINNYKDGLSKNKVWQGHFEVNTPKMIKKTTCLTMIYLSIWVKIPLCMTANIGTSGRL